MEHADPLTLIDQLDPEVIEAQLAELGRQRDALRVLLKAARARDKRPAPEVPPAPEVANAR
jgi:hypothetical protein